MIVPKKKSRGENLVPADGQGFNHFFALPEMKPKACYKMTVPTSYSKKQALPQNDSPSKKHTCYKMTWFSVTKYHFFLQIPPRPGHGSPHFIVEMCTKILFEKFEQRVHPFCFQFRPFFYQFLPANGGVNPPNKKMCSTCLRPKKVARLC